MPTLNWRSYDEVVLSGQCSDRSSVERNENGSGQCSDRSCVYNETCSINTDIFLLANVQLHDNQYNFLLDTK